MAFLWFIIGISATLAVQSFHRWVTERGLRLSWWQWLLLGLWALALAGTIGFVTTNLGEREVRAAMVGGAMFGLVVIVTAVGLWRWLLTPGGRKAPGSRAKGGSLAG